MAPIVVPDEGQQQQVKVSVRANENNNDERVTIVAPPAPGLSEPRTSGGATVAAAAHGSGDDKMREQQQQRDFGATTTTMDSKSSGWSIQKAPGKEPEKLEEELETASRVGVKLSPLPAAKAAAAAFTTKTALPSSRLSQAGSRLAPLKLCQDLASSRAQDDEEGEEASAKKATGSRSRRLDSANAKIQALTSLFAHVDEVQMEASLLLSGEKTFRYSTSSMSPNEEFADTFTDVNPSNEQERKTSLASLKVTTTTGDASNGSQSVSPMQTPYQNHSMNPFKLDIKSGTGDHDKNGDNVGDGEEEEDLTMLKQLMEKRSELRSLDRRLLNEMVKYLDRLGLANLTSLTAIDNQPSSNKLQALFHELGINEALSDSMSSSSSLEQPHSTSLSQLTGCLGHTHHNNNHHHHHEPYHHHHHLPTSAMDLSQMSTKFRHLEADLKPQAHPTESTKTINLKKARLLAAHNLANTTPDSEMSEARTLSTPSTAQIIKLDQRSDLSASFTTGFRFNVTPQQTNDLHRVYDNLPAGGTSIRLQHKKFRLGISMDESNATAAAADDDDDDNAGVTFVSNNNINSPSKHNNATNNSTATDTSSIISEYKPNIASLPLAQHYHQQHMAGFPPRHQLSPQSQLLASNPLQRLTPPIQALYGGSLFSTYNEHMKYYPQQLNATGDKMTHVFSPSNDSASLINKQVAGSELLNDSFQRHHHQFSHNLFQSNGYQLQQQQATNNNFDTTSSSAASAEAYALALQQHQRIAFRCHVCGSGFEDRHRLQQHLSIHLNLQASWFEEKTIKETMAQYESKRGDYLCQACNMRYETTADFDRHMQLHGDKPHRCELCGQDNKLVSFRYYRQLLTHLRSHCFLYSCRFSPDCKQTANRKDYLKLHILKHHLNNKLPEQYTICCH